MQDLSSLGKGFLVLGVGLCLLGGALLLAGKVPGLGRLPGDVRIEREHFSFYFPWVTCLVLSLALSLVLWVASKWK